MAVNPSSVGKSFGPFKKKYNYKDLLKYAVSVGAGADDIQYAYEKDQKALPSYAVTVITDQPPDLVKAMGINVAGAVHYEHELIIHNSFPVKEGTFVSNSRILDIMDRGEEKGAQIQTECETCDETGVLLFTNRSTSIAKLDGGFGGKAPDNTKLKFPDRDPDCIERIVFPENQAFLYRLNGDFNILHVDQKIAKKFGYDTPLLHGLLSFGYACRFLIKHLCGNDSSKLSRMKVRFAKPIFPGDEVQLQIWKTEGQQGCFRMIKSTGETVIDCGEVNWLTQEELEVRESLRGMRFDNQVAVITGAGQGLGKAYAMALAERGANLVINDMGKSIDRNGAEVMAAQLVVEELKEMNCTAISNYDAVGTAESGSKIIKAAVDAFGRVDILINNAGIVRDSSFGKMTEQEWDSVMNVHVKGMFHITQSAFHVMKRQEYGRIIMTTSPAGIFGNFGQANYAAAKTALIGFMNAVKMESDKYNIRINAVAPTALTPMSQKTIPPNLHKYASPGHIASLILYLASRAVGESGGIYQAGVGSYGRVAVVANDCTMLGDGITPVSPEVIAENWKQINNLDNARYYPSAREPALKMFGLIPNEQ